MKMGLVFGHSYFGLYIDAYLCFLALLIAAADLTNPALLRIRIVHILRLR